MNIVGEGLKLAVKLTEKVCKVAIGLAALGAMYVIDLNMPESYGGVNDGYYDAVEAIMNSGMWSEDKRKAIDAMKRNGSAAYYRTVIGIVYGAGWSADKIEMIKGLK